MSDTKTVKWGILGTARIAKNAVGPGINEAKSATLTAVAGRDREKTDAFARDLKIAKVHYSYDALLDDPDVEAVYIPLPNALHREWTVKAVKKGKHVLCEKPLAMNAAEAREMIQAADANKVLLAEAFAYRHNPVIAELKRLADSGRIGKVRTIESHFSFPIKTSDDIRLDKALGGGAAYDVGCYPVSLIRYLAGQEPESVIAKKRMDPKTGVDMAASGVMTFASGLHASFYCAFDTLLRTDTRVWGEKGCLTLLKSFNAKGNLDIVIEDAQGTETVTVTSGNNYMLETEQFSRSILDGGVPLVSHEESLGNARALDSILA